MEHSPELADVARRLYDATVRGDLDAIAGLVSTAPGVVTIGTDPGEWWAGHGPLMEAWRSQVAEIGGWAGVRPGSFQLYREGDVGWLVDAPTWLLHGGGEVPMRLTVIFQREADTWKVVHMHNSIGVPNLDALGRP